MGEETKGHWSRYLKTWRETTLREKEQKND